MNKRFAFVSWHRSVLSVGIGIALTMFGPAIHRARAQSATVTSTNNISTMSKMKQFVIIFRQGPRKLTEAELTQRQKEVSAWAKELNATGHKLEPRILAPEVLRPRTGEENGVGKDAWPITAFLFLEADDLDAAAKIAASHPAVQFGVSVEVRPWAPPAVPAPPSK